MVILLRSCARATRSSQITSGEEDLFYFGVRTSDDFAKDVSCMVSLQCWCDDVHVSGLVGDRDTS